MAGFPRERKIFKLTNSLQGNLISNVRVKCLNRISILSDNDEDATGSGFRHTVKKVIRKSYSMGAHI